MTKSELVQKLMDVNGLLSRKDSELVVNMIFDSMTDALKREKRWKSAGSEASRFASVKPVKPETRKAER